MSTEIVSATNTCTLPSMYDVGILNASLLPTDRPLHSGILGAGRSSALVQWRPSADEALVSILALPRTFLTPVETYTMDSVVHKECTDLRQI